MSKKLCLFSNFYFWDWIYFIGLFPWLWRYEKSIMPRERFNEYSKFQTKRKKPRIKSFKNTIFLNENVLSNFDVLIFVQGCQSAQVGSKLELQLIRVDVGSNLAASKNLMKMGSKPCPSINISALNSGSIIEERSKI